MTPSQREAIVAEIMRHYTARMFTDPNEEEWFREELRTMAEADVKRGEAVIDRMVLDARFETLLEVAAFRLSQGCSRMTGGQTPNEALAPGREHP